MVVYGIGVEGGFLIWEDGGDSALGPCGVGGVDFVFGADDDIVRVWSSISGGDGGLQPRNPRTQNKRVAKNLRQQVRPKRNKVSLGFKEGTQGMLRWACWAVDCSCWRALQYGMSKSVSKLERVIQQANASLEQENFGSAIVLYKKALSMDKNNPRLMQRLGQVMIAAGMNVEAVEILKKAVKRRPNHPNTLVLLSQGHLALGNMDAMHAALERALSQDPAHGASVLAKVNAYVDSGLTESAVEFIERLTDLAEPDALVLIAKAKVARQTKAFDEAIGHLQMILDQANALERHKRSARFELGAVYDAMGEYDRAFEYFKRANGGHIHGKVAHRDSIQSAWSPEVLNGIRRSTVSDERAVIVAGMPRSGTTLTERIVNAHPMGASVGECPVLLNQMSRTLAGNLDQSLIDQYAREYASHLDEQVGGGARRVIDKHMGTEKTLGFISRVLPEARVIHALRDPRDCCLSAYFQNFGVNVSYARDLKQLGEQYVAHREMMEYWFEHLELPVYVNVYEEFVSDAERYTRELLGFLGLEFDEACLKFYEARDHVRTASATQVREPVYQNRRQRWKNYEKHIGELLDALGPYADGVLAEQTVWSLE